VLHSRIVVPSWFSEREATERALILAHENEHVKARDPALLAGALLALVAFPWNAPLWWQCFRIKQAVELDCDQRVLARGTDPRAYSRLLLEVTARHARQPMAIASLSDSSSLLERRIRAMLAHRKPRRRAVDARSFMIAGAALVAACSVDRPTAVPEANGTNAGDGTSPLVEERRVASSVVEQGQAHSGLQLVLDSVSVGRIGDDGTITWVSGQESQSWAAGAVGDPTSYAEVNGRPVPVYSVDITIPGEQNSR
jgi:hypothetical protein